MHCGQEYFTCFLVQTCPGQGPHLQNQFLELLGQRLCTCTIFERHCPTGLQRGRVSTHSHQRMKVPANFTARQVKNMWTRFKFVLAYEWEWPSFKMFKSHLSRLFCKYPLCICLLYCSTVYSDSDTLCLEISLFVISVSNTFLSLSLSLWHFFNAEIWKSTWSQLLISFHSF